MRLRGFKAGTGGLRQSVREEDTGYAVGAIMLLKSEMQAVVQGKTRMATHSRLTAMGPLLFCRHFCGALKERTARGSSGRVSTVGVVGSPTSGNWVTCQRRVQLSGVRKT